MAVLIAGWCCGLLLDDRPPVEILRTAEENGGYRVERHRVDIAGAAVRDDGSPAAGQTVMLVSLSSYAGNDRILGATTTDADGLYEFPNAGLLAVARTRPTPNPVEAIFQVFAHGDAGWAWSSSMTFKPAGAEADSKPADFSAVVLSFMPPTKLSGSVTTETGDPIEDATIRFGAVEDRGRKVSRFRVLGGGDHPPLFWLPPQLLETKTSNDGRYSFDALPTGVEASFQAAPEGDLAPITRQIRLVESETKSDFVFDLPRPIFVRVVDADGDPVENATVFPAAKDREQAAVQTDSDGVASFKSQPTPYRFAVRPPAGVLLLPAETQPFEAAALAKPVTILLSQGAGVRVRVVDEDRKPVEGVRVGYAGTDPVRPLHSTTFHIDNPVTSANGELTAVLPPNGGTRLVAIREGSRRDAAAAGGPESEFVSLTPGKTTEVTLTRKPIAADSTISARPDGIPPKTYEADCENTEAIRQFRGVVQLRNLATFSGIDGPKLLQVLDALPLNEAPDVDSVLEAAGIKNPRTGEPYSLTRLELRRTPVQRLVKTTRERENTSTTDWHLIGPEWSVRYDGANRQVNVLRRADDRYYSPSMSSVVRAGVVCGLPSDAAIETDADGRLVLTAESDDVVTTVRVDPTSGLILRSELSTKENSEPQTVSYQFAPSQYGSVFLPTARFDLRKRRDGWSLRVVEVVSAEEYASVPPGTFSVPVPPRAVLVDNRFDEPGRPRRSQATSVGWAVPDILSYVMRERPSIAPARPALVYGKPSPKISFSGGLTGDVPAIDGRITVLYFTSPRDSNDHLLEYAAQLAKQHRDDVRVLAVYPFSAVESEDREKATKHFASKKLPYSAVVDGPPVDGDDRGATAMAFDARYPNTAVIAADGTLLHFGHVQSSVRAAERAIARRRTQTQAEQE